MPPTHTIEASGAILIDENSYHPNFQANDGDNLIFKPSGEGSVDGEASLTFVTAGVTDLIWSSILAELTLQSSSVPVDFKTILSLYGITHNKMESLIGEQVITTLPTTETTTIYAFDLASSACGPSLIVDNNLTTAGKIRVNLPHRWRSPAAVGFEDIILTLRYFFKDLFSDASIGADWTVNTPTGGVDESGGTMNVTLLGGVTSNSFTTCPIVTTPVPSGENWVARTKLTNPSLSNEVKAGFMLMSDRSHLEYLEVLRNVSGNYLLDGGNTTTKHGGNISLTSPVMYFEIEYKNGRYYFKYSTNGTAYTPYYSTTNLGFTPTKIGFFADHWGAKNLITATFDYIYISSQQGDTDFDEVLSPATAPLDDDTYVLFNSPATLFKGVYADVAINEINNYDILTRPAQISDRGILNLGYSGLDIYDALKFQIQTRGDTNCNVKCNWITCKVEL